MTVMSVSQLNVIRNGVPLWRPIDLSIKAGELILLLGDTGTGKSTLLTAMAGLLKPDGGAIRCNGRCGLVLQDPCIQLIRDQIGPEVAVLLECLQVQPEQMQARVTAALKLVDLDLPLDQPTQSLSQGQRYRLLIAAQLVATPQLLLLDEPWAQMDDDSFIQLQQVLKTLLQQGVSVVVSEHQAEPWAALASQTHQLSAEGLNPPKAVSSKPIRSAQPSTASLVKLSSGECTLAVGQRKLSLPPLTLHQGERALLCGSNGCGKSTLLGAMLGLTAEIEGDFRLLPDLDRESVKHHVGLVLQQPAKQLFATTVLEELCFSQLRQGISAAAAEAESMALLARLKLDNLAERSPYTLSYGQQHLVAISSQLLRKPQLLLLDDPFAGLDHHSTEVLWQLLDEHTDSCATVIASHRPIAGVHSHWQIEQDRLYVA
ncbi:ATP-binding cassette domain-containing protein [Ferrimonas lipolytica]|uniref:ABC transporter ATP-binding protein n=1 Tax=Ferrimonas lipolytica TaxID=2724191 RepID=A0A6H1UEP0_9GAMM|nr:ABC transporter ATP-binding protein [Ferrimonas lipolytica]QIZ77298.1 ABC transporter ATP-binding protein [Ferrimonas lipolytica]